MQTVAETVAIAALGVDHLGLTPAERGLPGEIDFATARQIRDAVQGMAVVVALTVDGEFAPIQEMVAAVRPDILHLCGLENSLPPAAVAELRALLPGLPIMQAISVNGPAAVDAALAYEPVAEYIILDTQAADIAGIGASGVTHDWNVSREIVRRVKIPVILAGGLAPENVAAAIAQVKPWAVDSLTHTNQPLPGGGFRKDLERVRQFVAAARGTA
jgi:phosphoribosylanthranilate isomerase